MKGRFELQDGQYYSTKDVSTMLAINQSTVKRWSDSGKLKCFRTPGGHRRYTPDRILEFMERFKYGVEPAPRGTTYQEGRFGNTLLDIVILNRDYHTLCEMCFVDALKGDAEGLTRLLLDCSLKAEIPLAVIHSEIVSKSIRKIKRLGQQQKVDKGRQDGAVNSILESFIRLKDVLYPHRSAGRSND